jgi:hypothetical protein
VPKRPEVTRPTDRQAHRVAEEFHLATIRSKLRRHDGSADCILKRLDLVQQIAVGGYEQVAHGSEVFHNCRNIDLLVSFDDTPQFVETGQQLSLGAIVWRFEQRDRRSGAPLHERGFEIRTVTACRREGIRRGLDMIWADES